MVIHPKSTAASGTNGQCPETEKQTVFPFIFHLRHISIPDILSQYLSLDANKIIKFYLSS